jgi:large subunit ribosomal protein L21
MKKAVIQTGGKQYIVEEGSNILVEILHEVEPEAKSPVSFDSVLMIQNDDTITMGKPTIAGATVSGEIVREVKGPKLIAFKKIRRHGYERKVGHRQKYYEVKVTSITA